MQHPAHAVLLDALKAQPELSMFCTFHDDFLIEWFGAERMVRMPITENAMVGMAIGMGLAGRRTLVSIARAAFLLTALDPLINHATKWRYMSDGQFHVPLVIRGITRGREYLGAQHEHVPHALLSQVPGLVVAVPGSPKSAAGLMATALVHPDPVVILESPLLYGAEWESMPDGELSPDPLPFGVAGLMRDGGDVTLVAIGNTVALSLLVAQSLAEQGIQCRVVDLRTASPLDRDGVAGLVRGPVVLVDEAPAAASVMAELGLRLVQCGAVAPDRLTLLAGALVPAPASPHLLDPLLPNVDSLLKTVCALAEGGR